MTSVIGGITLGGEDHVDDVKTSPPTDHIGVTDDVDAMLKDATAM